MEKMADGVYAALSKPATFVNCNAVIFENSSDLLVVDSHSKPSAAASLIAQIRKELTPKPVRYLVNSHFHWDHTQGNSAYRRASSKLDIIASESTRRLLAEGGASQLKRSLDVAEKSLDGYREKLGASKTAEEKAHWERMVADTKSYLREMKDYTPDLPTITVKGDLVLHDKAHELHVVFRGRGHTEGDVSVWCPSKRVMATGDLAHGSLPYMGDGYPNDWPNTLVGVAMLEFDKFAGGHAGVQMGKTRMYQMRDYIEELGMRIERGLRLGKSAEELQKEITPTTMKSLAGGYADALMRGMDEGFGRSKEQALAGGVAGNVRQVFAALKRP